MKRKKKTCGECWLLEKGGWCWNKEERRKKSDEACRDYRLFNE